MSKKNKETTVKDLVEIFLPKLWIIILAGVVFAAAMFVYSYFFKEDTYTSSADVYLYKDGGGVSTGDINTAQEMVAVYADVIEGNTFFDLIKPKIEDNGYPSITHSQFKKLVTVTQKDDKPMFTVKVISSDPEMSCKIAEVVKDGIDSYIASDILQNSIKSKVTNEPQEPVRPDSKNTARNTIICGVIGVLLATVAVWIHSNFDVIIRNSKKIEDNLDVPVLGVIPRHDVTLNDKGDGANV